MPDIFLGVWNSIDLIEFVVLWKKYIGHNQRYDSKKV